MYICQLSPPLIFFFALTEVWLGEYKGAKVAIKMLKDLKDAKASQQVLAEASIMTYVDSFLSFVFHVLSSHFPSPPSPQHPAASKPGVPDWSVSGQSSHLPYH